MNSCLYECQVMHARLSPRAHRFVYRLFLFAIDLEELPRLSRRLLGFSHQRPNLYAFRERDFLPVDEPAHPPGSAEMGPAGAAAAASLRGRVAAFAARHGVDLSGGRVVVVALPRVLGYQFNPVTFYFCFDAAGRPAAAIAEVTNTFREVKPYFLPAAPGSPPGEFRLRVPKHFYVSPFSDVEVAFDFCLRVPADRLAIQIDDYAGTTRTLTSTLTGARRELTSARLLWYTVKYPLLSVRVMALIHWQAFRLWLKRVPWYAKAARAAEQRGLFRPHASLTAARTPREIAASPSLPA